LQILEQDEETKGETTIFDYMEGLTLASTSSALFFFKSVLPRVTLVPLPAEIAIFRTINQLMSDEKRAEHVLDELENIDQDGAN
jgi:hypothetical protein